MLFEIISNSWSDEGVSTIIDGNSVECRTTHLTSFAVLVDTQGSTSTTTSTAESVGFLSIYPANTVYSHFRLFLLLATLAVVYQYSVYF